MRSLKQIISSNRKIAAAKAAAAGKPMTLETEDIGGAELACTLHMLPRVTNHNGLNLVGVIADTTQEEVVENIRANGPGFAYGRLSDGSIGVFAPDWALPVFPKHLDADTSSSK